MAERITDPTEAVTFLLKYARGKGLHQDLPYRYRSNSPKGAGGSLRWERDLDVTYRYYPEKGLGQSQIETAQQIGADYGVTKARVDQIAQSVITVLWERSLPEIEELVDTRAIQGLRRKNTLYGSIVQSKAAGGRLAEVYQKTKDGASYADLRRGVNTGTKLGETRTLLKRYSIRVPNAEASRSSRLAAELEKAKTAEEKEKAMAKTDRAFLAYLSHRGNELRVVIPLSEALTKVNRSRNTRMYKKLLAAVTEAEEKPFAMGSFPLNDRPDAALYLLIFAEDAQLLDRFISDDAALSRMFRKVEPKAVN